MDLGLKGKVALICAASRGLGRAVALELAREGAHVAFCARDAAGIANANDAVKAINNDGALAVVADVGNTASERAAYVNGVSLQVDGGFCRGLL